jgi:hypothetical protein
MRVSLVLALLILLPMRQSLILWLQLAGDHVADECPCSVSPLLPVAHRHFSQSLIEPVEIEPGKWSESASVMLRAIVSARI